MKYCISVSDIYGTDTPKVPEGYKLTGEFRPAKLNEDYLQPSSGCVNTWLPGFGDFPKEMPRLILSKLPPPPTIESIYGTKEPKIPEGYESTGELREVKDGDIYLGATWAKGAVQTWSGPAITSSAYHRLILRKVKTYSDAEIIAFLIDLINQDKVYSTLDWARKAKVTKAKIIEKMREKGL